MIKREVCLQLPSSANYSLTPAALAEFGASVGNALGKGAYGTVYRHESKLHGEVAIKSMFGNINGNTELSGDAVREISALVALTPHPDVIRLLGFEVPRFDQLNAAGDADPVSLVLEMGLMTLSDAIKFLSGATAKTVWANMQLDTRDIMYQILRGVNYMHSQDIWHRDIKPNNILVTSIAPKIKVKIADFGLSSAGPFCNVVPTELMYTLWYRAPEILIQETTSLFPKHSRAIYNEHAETWALGIVFWDLLAVGNKSAQILMRDLTPEGQLQRFMDARGWPENVNDTPFELDPMLLKKSLTYLLPSFQTITAHNGYKMRTLIQLPPTSPEWALLSRMLMLNPKQRITTLEALSSPYFDSVRTPDQAKLAGTRQSKLEKLYLMQRVSLDTGCLRQIPGKIAGYTSVCTTMLNFMLKHRVLDYGDQGTYSLAVFLLELVLSKLTMKSSHQLLLAGLCCCTLASKYNSKHPLGVSMVKSELSNSLKAVAENPLLADLEASIFRTLSGQLHLPTPYRFLVEFTKCPVKGSPMGDVFAWAVGILFAAQQSQAAFIGQPSDLAKLALNIAHHYYRYRIPVDNTSTEASLTSAALIEGAKYVYTCVVNNKKGFQSIKSVIQSLLADPYTKISFEHFLLVLQGQAQYSPSPKKTSLGVGISDDDSDLLEDDDEETEQEKPQVSRKRRAIDEPLPLPEGFEASI